MNRKSNIELLRIVAMIFVLILHANSLSNGLPNIEDVISNPVASFTRLSVQTFTNVAVNVFVLISGWFGIKFSLKGITNILFQCVFYSLLALTLVGFLDPSSIQLSSIVKLLHIGGTYWFVPAYIGLMILSPILNNYVEHTSQTVQKNLLVAFFLFQFVYGWLFLDEAHFINGYSCFSFVLLYLLARYLNRFWIIYLEKSARFYLFSYLLLSLISSIIIFVSLYGNEVVASIIKDKVLAYNNPLCIVSSVCFLLFFLRVDIGVNRYINWLAKSSFAIYLVHCNMLILPFYKRFMHYLYITFDGVVVLALGLFFILCIALCSIFIDKVRIIVWDRLIH